MAPRPTAISLPIRFCLWLVLALSIAACSDRDDGPADTGTATDAGGDTGSSVPDASGDTGTPMTDAGTDTGAPMTDAGGGSGSCDCDTSSSCDGWCYCDADCPNPCACDATSWCDAECACDVACEGATADVYPYNLCHNNSDCPGGYCAKGTCVAFCNPSFGCGFAFECRGDSCLYSCTGESDCFGDGYACTDGVCLPAALRASSTGPAGWTCAAEYYGTGDGCDCSCGVTDPDCTDSTCDWCHDTDDVTFICPMTS